VVNPVFGSEPSPKFQVPVPLLVLGIFITISNGAQPPGGTLSETLIFGSGATVNAIVLVSGHKESIGYG